jgi:phenylpropionate dioxygenase-like ring-hydroxylating dioxygenase large terminal subunit
MPFLSNAWYVAAWSSEVKDAPFHRTILNEPVLMYRKPGGEAIAMADRCVHRFAPLHLGRLVGDSIECPYHGLRYDSAGNCVHSPHGDGAVLKSARLKSYPMVERFGALWIWMGAAEVADPANIPDYSFLTDAAKYTTVTGASRIEANFELITDNLMDLSHVSFLHAESFGGANIARAKIEVIQEGTTVKCNRLCVNDPATATLRAALNGYDKPMDFWLDMRWEPASAMRLDIGVTPAGRPRSEGVHHLEPHLLTPETDATTHYFWGDSRPYLLNDSNTSEVLLRVLRQAFDNEDKPLIEAQQRMMGTTDLWPLHPVLLKCDAGAIRARQVLARLIAQERGAETAK